MASAVADEREIGVSLLIVDDNDPMRERLARAFDDRGFDVRTAIDYEDALRVARKDSPEMAVIDMRMPGGNGMDLLRELLRLDPNTKVVVLTGYGSIATAVDAIKLGAVNYLQKPADADEILAAFDPDAKDKPVAPVPSLARVEWEHIHRVLTECEDNISEAARRLGIHRRSLQRKLKKRAPE